MSPLVKDNKEAEGDGEEDGGADGVDGVPEEGGQDRGQQVVVHSWRGPDEAKQFTGYSCIVNIFNQCLFVSKRRSN